MTDFLKWAQSVMDTAVEQCLKDNHLVPTAFLRSRSAYHLIPAHFTTSQEKKLFAHMVRNLAKHIGATSSGFVSEAWVSLQTEEEYEAGKYAKPSDDPQRIEVIIGSFQQLYQQPVISQYKIIRNDAGKICDLEMMAMFEKTPGDYMFRFLDLVVEGFAPVK